MTDSSARVASLGSIPKRLMLLQPPFYRLYHERAGLDRNPLGLSYLAGAVRTGTDWRVTLVNADYSFSAEPSPLSVAFLSGAGFNSYIHNLSDPRHDAWVSVARALDQYQPSVIGISATSQTFGSACQAASLVKKCNPAAIVVVGGPHASTVGAEALECPAIDIAVIGEGEVTIVDLLNCLANSGDMSLVEGIAFREGQHVVQNSRRALIQNLDDLPAPITILPQVLDRFEDYPPQAFGAVFASRGCPNSCTFCGSRQVWTNKVRWRSPENVVDEMERLKSFGVQSVYFVDDIFGVTKTHILELCEQIIERGVRIDWSCELHAGTVSAQVLECMSRAGCTTIQLGVESGCDRVLEAVRKNTSIAQATNAARLIKERGIRLEAFFMVGFPMETTESLSDTFRTIKGFPADQIHLSFFTPYPGTEIFEDCRKAGLIEPGFDPALHNHQSPMNYFSPSIPRAEYDSMLRAISAEVDRINSRDALAHVFSPHFLRVAWRSLRKRGLGGTVREGVTNSWRLLRRRP